MLVFGIFVAANFIYASYSATNGFITDKLFLANDQALLIDTLYAVPGNAFIVYNNTYLTTIKDHTLTVSENLLEPTPVKVNYVPIGKIEYDKSIQGQTVFTKFDSSFLLSDNFNLDKIRKKHLIDKKNINQIFYIYDDDTKDLIQNMGFLFDKSLATAIVEKKEDSLYLFFNEGEDVRIQYSVNSEHAYVLSTLIRDITGALLEPSNLEYSDAIILTMPGEILSNIRQKLQISIGEVYEVE